MSKPLAAALILALCANHAARAQTQSAPAPPAILAQDTKGTPDQRARQLLSEMTLQEKISLLSGNQFTTRKIDRLGIPGFDMTDGPNGVRNAAGERNPMACAFPCGAALAATWDVNLAADYGRAVGLEGRARGTQFQLGPGVNICRAPVNGRNFEYFGEDPFLAAMINVNWVKACSATGVVPTIKHFAANNEEADRNSVSVIVDERTMHEIYLPAFKKGVQEGGTVAVMCSYNRINGTFASNNDWLLNQVLKQTWGFQGLVMSDWGASHNVTDVAHGLDLEMPNGANLSQTKITAALADGLVKESDIDNAVLRSLRTAAAMGWLDANWVKKDTSLPEDSPASAKVAQEVAEASIVLLKNENNLLPLDKSRVKRIVVLGPNARAAAIERAPDAPPGPAIAIPQNIGGGGSGAVNPYPAHYEEADYFRSLAKFAGDNIQVDYIPMPGEQETIAAAGGGGGGGGRNRGGGATTAAADTAMFDSFPDAHTPDGQPGLIFTGELTGDNGTVDTIPPLIQQGINVQWEPGKFPFFKEMGREVTLTWKGNLRSDTDEDWELRTAGSLEITLNGQPASNGALVHLARGQSIPIQIVARVASNPPGRGRRGGGGGGGGTQLRATLARPAVPDLSSLRDADAVILCIGLNRNVESEGRDRPFELPAVQQVLIKRAADINPRTIVITNGGAAIGMTHWNSSAAAILHAWYLGQEGGIALARTLFGEVNPSGRLCSTFDARWEDNPAFPNYPGKRVESVDFPVVKYEEGLFYGYRGYDKSGDAPLYPFGYGLSYTSFALSNMRTEKTAAGINVTLDVKNTGPRAGADVVEIYVGEQNAPLPRPVRELKGFTKVTLNPGETRRVQISLPPESFSYWSPDKKDWTTDRGATFTIEAASSERDIALKQNVQL